MARLLRDLDYERVIQDTDLAQIINNNAQAKLDVEQSAQAEMISYLVQRYRTNDIFTNTTVFDPTVTYYGKNLVEFTAAAYNSSSTYGTSSYVTHGGYIYKGNTSNITGAWDITKWNLICADKSLFYIKLPYPEYDSTASYTKTNQVWYNKNIYTCKQNCSNIDPTQTAFWTDDGAYTVSGIYPDDTSKWIAGDNRNQQIVMYLIDMVLFHLLSRVMPRLIPDLRKERYNGNDPMDRGGALGWLNKVAKGNVNADLPEYLMQQGLSMRYGNAGTTALPSHNQLW